MFLKVIFQAYHFINNVTYLCLTAYRKLIVRTHILDYIERVLDYTHFGCQINRHWQDMKQPFVEHEMVH